MDQHGLRSRMTPTASIPLVQLLLYVSRRQRVVLNWLTIMSGSRSPPVAMMPAMPTEPETVISSLTSSLQGLAGMFRIPGK